MSCSVVGSNKSIAIARFAGDTDALPRPYGVQQQALLAELRLNFVRSDSTTVLFDYGSMRPRALKVPWLAWRMSRPVFQPLILSSSGLHFSSRRPARVRLLVSTDLFMGIINARGCH